MKKNVYLMFFIAFLQALVFYYPVLTLYRQAFGITLWQMSVLEAICLIITAVFEFPWGILADHIGLKKTLILANFFYFLSKVIFWRAESFDLFLLERIVLGIACAGVSGCDSSILYCSSGEKDADRNFSIYSALATAGLLSVSAAYSLVLSRFPMKLTSTLTMFSYLISLLLTFMLDEVKDLGSTKMKSDKMESLGKQLLQKKNLLLFSSCSRVVLEIARVVCVVFAQVLLISSGLTKMGLGGYVFLLTLCGYAGLYSYRVRNRQLYFAAAYMLCGILVLSGSVLKQPVIIALFLLIVEALIHVCSPLISLTEQNYVFPKYRASMISFFSAVSNALCIVVSLGLGAASAMNIRTAYLIAGIMIIALGAAILYFYRNVIKT